MYLKYLFAVAAVRQVDGHASVEAPGTKQGGVEHVRAVRRRHHHDLLGRLEAVHLDQDLIQGLFALVVAAAHACATHTPDRIDLVDEDDRGRRLLRHLEEVPNPRRTHTYKHLHKLGAGDREERYGRFAGDRAREKRLASAGRAHQDDAQGDL